MPRFSSTLAWHPRPDDGGWSSDRLSAAQELVLRASAKAPPLTLFRRLDSSPRGLTEHDAAERLRLDGDNRIEPSAARSGLARLRIAVSSPFVALMAGLAMVFAAVGDVRGCGTVAVMVALSVGLRWWQQNRSDSAMRALQSRVTNTVTVRRRAHALGRGVEREIPVEDVVPGDVVVLSPGDVVPADLRLLTARNLRIDQSALSGEALPVHKRAPSHRPLMVLRDPGVRLRNDVVELDAVCFAGTNVVGGTATAVVLATGAATYFGLEARRAASPRPDSSVDSGVRSVGWTLVRFMLVMAPIVLLVNGTVSGDWTQAALFAAAVAVGLTPEMLPVIVTTTLARGAHRLAARDVIVKRLDAIQDLGAMDVLCLDKTGTLTEDRVVFAQGMDSAGRLDDEVISYAYLTAHFQSAALHELDRAIGECVAEDDAVLADAVYTAVDEIPFDHQRRRSTIVLHSGGTHLLVTKGDPDSVLGICTHARSAAGVAELDSAARAHAAKLVARYQGRGMRMLAIAVKEAPARVGHYGPDDEAGLELVGYIGVVDPVRASAPAAVIQLADHGVELKILTGDSLPIAVEVCQRVGIPIGTPVLGREIDDADDAMLSRLVADATVFAKVNPHHKARIVAALRDTGHTVGFIGDGVNDATALRTADVGISIENATDVAKNAADLILLDPDLTVLADAVIEGRRTLGNTMKYVRITAASNLGNVISVLIAGAVLPFLPMLPIQLMVQNLLYDMAQLVLPWDRVDPEYLRSPRPWDATGLTRFMLIFGALSSVFDFVTFALLWFVLGINTVGQQAIFQTGWFIEGLATQVLVVLILRTRQRGFRLRAPSGPVLTAAVAVASLGVIVPFSPLATALHLRAVPLAFLLYLPVIVGGYLAAVQLVKTFYPDGPRSKTGAAMWVSRRLPPRATTPADPSPLADPSLSKESRNE
jgi:Mg2+-importing ATPase